MENNYDPVDGFPGWTCLRFSVGGVQWVRLRYDDVYVAQFRQGKKYLMHYITVQRYSSIEKAIRYYDSLRRWTE